jgi:Ca2+-binding RTX toxin-like protein
MGGGTGNDLMFGDPASEASTSIRVTGPITAPPPTCGICWPRNDLGIDDNYLNSFSQSASGNDTMWGGSGRDMMFGGWGNDVMGGGFGDDLVVGNRGDDVIFGGKSGNDVLLGGDENDTIFGGNGNDIIDADETPAPATIPPTGRNKGDARQRR